VRKLQGLSANSFSGLDGAGFSVRAGTSLNTKATEETMTIEETKLVSYATVTTRPRCKKPPLVVPDAVVEAGIEGTVRVSMDLDSDGKVFQVRVVRSLSPEADAACVQAWTAAKCKPARQEGGTVGVTGMPHKCTYRAMD